MFKQLLSLLLACATVAVAATLSLSTADASALAHPHKVTLGVTASASQSGTLATYSFSFTGAEVSGFQLSLPKGILLRSRSFTALRRDLGLRDPDGHKLGYAMESSGGHSLSVNLAGISQRFKVLFNAAALSFTPAEAKLIRSGQVKSVTLIFTFMGSAEQFTTARMKLRV